MRNSHYSKATSNEFWPTNPPTLGAIPAVTYRRITREELNDRYALTSRECEIAFALSAGATSAEIAETMGISSHTVRHHTERVFRKLGIRSRAAVAGALFIPCQTPTQRHSESAVFVS
jgi:DNA-binding CsgD family transcriptional regulator